MRHLVIAATLLLAGLTWVVFGRGGGASDPLAARDALLAGDVELTGGQLGARFTVRRLADGRWAEYDDGQIESWKVFNGSAVLWTITEGCYQAAVSEAVPTEPRGIPELARSLLSGIEIERQGDLVTYSRPLQGNVAGLRPDIEYTEDLSEIASGTIRVTRTPLGGPREGFAIRALDGSAASELRRLLDNATPSEMAHVTVWAVAALEGTLGGAVEHREIEVPRDCPRLLFGGTDVLLTAMQDGAWFVEDALVTDLEIVAPVDDLIRAVQGDHEPMTAHLEPGLRLLVPIFRFDAPDDLALVLAVEVLSCEETDWFSCAPMEVETP